MAMDSPVADPHLNHLFDGEETMNVYSNRVVNLSAGAPGPDILTRCVDMFRQATNHTLEKESENAFLFQYGIAAGLWEFRQELSKFLSHHYGTAVNRADLILTCGATHGLQLAMGTFLDPRAVIFVEEVTYMIALDVFKGYPLMKIVSVPLMRDGVDPDALESIARKAKENWPYQSKDQFWAMFYTVPIHHNPTGCTMSPQCCQKVVEVARKLDLLVICDDVYNLLYYGNELHPPKRLITYDDHDLHHGHIISNGSFSKILAPGIRVGWLELAPRLTLRLRNSGILVSGGAVNHYVSGVVTSLLQLGLMEKHLKFIVETLKDRMTSMCQVLRENLPDSCSFQEPEGGFFIWITLPKDTKAIDFTSWCKEKYKITAIPGSRFSIAGGHDNCLRITIAFHPKDTLQMAGRVLCKALGEYLMNKN